jgi:type IV pili sensor histidine kinase/response regulator
MVLDTASLDLINQEVRNCFLYEDVPDYLAALEQDIRALANTDALSDLTPIYTRLMRTAHSLKGGAGIAQLPNLSRLAHKLEDILELLDRGTIVDLEEIRSLIDRSADRINLLVAAAIRGGEVEEAQVAANMTIFAELDAYLQELAKSNSNKDTATTTELEQNNANFFLIKTALEVDLEDCLQRIEELLDSSQAIEVLQQASIQFIEECTLLGQALNISWLVEEVEKIGSALLEDPDAIEKIAKTAITSIRQLREQALSQGQENKKTEKSAPTPPASPTLPATPATAAPELKLRMPISRLNRINNTLGELLIEHERITLHQGQLVQASRILQKRSEQFIPIEEQIQTLYDRLTTTEASNEKVSPIQELEQANLPDRSIDEFDSLHLDRYTDLHSTLQDLQELMVRVQEARYDIDLITREFQESIDNLRQQLDSLRGDLTESRFVPFRTMSDRFTLPLANLNQQYNKSVELVVEGENEPIDLGILEQLETPLTHLFRNAFDHGIETIEERLAIGKPVEARITLSASIQGNQVVISIADDGRGINLEKVYEKAIKQNLCTASSIENLTQNQILEFIFTPGFSTAAAVTSLSGRGVGLDIVRLQIERLRGAIQVETEFGKGTKFSLSIPLSLSILPLLLCRCQNRTLAIPSNKIWEIISLSEFGNTKQIIWRDRPIRLYSLLQILPYAEASAINTNSPLALVLDLAGEPVAMAIDALLGERELVIKPFDATVKVPSYLTGCTVLGTGEVVPVLAPERMRQLIAQETQPQQQIRIKPDKLTQIRSEEACIAIVDDSIAVRRMLDRCLTQAGYQVFQYKDGKEAIGALNETGKHFDLVISDIEMPRLDGFGLLKEIRSHSRWHSLPVAMLTSRENELHRQKAASLGATHYFTKPFQPEELLKAIASILS